MEKKNNGRFVKGNKLQGKGTLGKHWKLSKEARENMSKSKVGKTFHWTKEHPKGIQHPRWIKDRTVVMERHRVRNSLEYKLWRTAVFQRDNYRCIWCGTSKPPFNADHIKPFAYFPELRFAIDNGRTLCVPCHKTTETYGTKSYKIYGEPDKAGTK